MCGMAVAACDQVGMAMETAVTPDNGCLMATAAGAALGPFEQTWTVSRMRAVTVGAAVCSPAYHMVMGTLQGGTHIFMTGKTIFLTQFAFSVAECTTLRVGLMQDVADQAPPFTAMRIMTGKALLGLYRKISMAGLYLLGGMATGAEIGDRFSQQMIVFGIVRIMTGRALALGIGPMGYLILRLQILMAGKTYTGAGFPDQQALDSGGMRLMTHKTLPAMDRSVNDALLKIFFLPVMTTITQICRLCGEQFVKPGHMRIMAVGAIPLGHRLMDYLVGKVFLVVALETDCLREGHGRP